MVNAHRLAAVKAYCEGNRTRDERGMADGIAHLADDRHACQRAWIAQSIAHVVDALTYSVDPAVQPATDAERVMALTSALGDVAEDVRVNAGRDLTAALVRLGAETQCWLEALAREGAR